MKALSKHEKFLFSLTKSSAATVAAQRAAIARHGLVGKSRADIVRIQRDNWKLVREKNPDVPSFVLAARHAYSEWRNQPPPGVKPGRKVDNNKLAGMAYEAVDWGRLRKRGTGKSSVWGAHMREESNGKSGWDRVVWRYADYGLVLSPDGKKIAVQVKSGAKWQVRPVWRKRFQFAGQLVNMNDPFDNRYRIRLRDCKRLLVAAGFDAYLARQSAEQISAGSGERGRDSDHKRVLVVNLGKYGYYHAVARADVVACVRSALAARKDSFRKEQIERFLSSGGVVFVAIDDSLAAGNCRPGSDAFAEVVRKHLGVESADAIGAVRSDVLLQLRDDQFVRRAIYSAAVRHGAKALAN